MEQVNSCSEKGSGAAASAIVILLLLEETKQMLEPERESEQEVTSASVSHNFIILSVSLMFQSAL